eukprot:2435989-Amphidinium_carterae.1
MDYFKTMQNKQIIHNKISKHKLPRLTRVQCYLHQRRLKNTTLHIYLAEIGASTVYKERAKDNIINKEDLQRLSKAFLGSTMPTSEAAQIKKHSETIGLHPYLGNRSINMTTRGTLRPRGSQSSRPRGTTPQPRQPRLQHIQVNETHIVKIETDEND